MTVNPFSTLQFKHSFRVYQARILDQLDYHLKDKKVHIVAPPGAGKTILGLEIIRRIQHKTLVLVPTLTIRNQWIERLQDDFSNGLSFSKQYISHQLDQPATLTVITYQALHLALKKGASVLEGLSFFSTIVVDECHHLKKEWWRSLNLVNETHQPILVALTATPPFDANGLEWRRYHEFCGSIDEEITTPELINSGDLCPHQDFIWPILPNINEQQAVTDFIEQRTELWAFLKDYQSLNLHIQEHPWMIEPEQHFESLYEQPEYFTAMLSVLKFLKSEPPVATLGVLHGEATIPPDLNNDWLAQFLNVALYKDDYWTSNRSKEILAPIKQRLSRMQAIDRKKVHLDIPKKLADRLRKSSNKLSAVADITLLEYEKLGEGLRMVILTDYIRSEALPSTKYDLSPLTTIGAAPIFEYLRRIDLQLLPSMALLTGSLMIVPKSCQPFLNSFAEEENLSLSFINIEGLADHVKIGIHSNSSKQMVRWITQLFTEGKVQIIIGTQALLGEGWDAPAINSLILANTVGSYVLSNQMRGRAIRINKKVSDKTANIWHLATIDNTCGDGGHDLKLLQRRFGAFIGPNHYGPAYLSNDFHRMINLPAINTSEELIDIQQKIKSLAWAREGLHQRWHEALTQGNQLVTAIQPPVVYKSRKDGLSKYYHLQASESIEQLATTLSTSFFYCLFIAFGVPAFLFFNETEPSIVLVWALVLGTPFILGGIGKSFRLLRTIYQLKKLRTLWQTIYYPIALFIVCSIFWLVGNIYAGSTFIVSAISCYSIYLLIKKFPTLSSWQFYKSIGQFQTFSFSIGKVILHSLINLNLVDPQLEEQLKVKKDKSNNTILYLDEVNRFESEIFEESLSEFLAPVDKQRYILAIQADGADQKEVHYMAVPSIFKHKQSAQEFCTQVTEVFDQKVHLIYTRTPAGRLHLLNARLQVLDLNEDNMARKEKIWL